MKTHVFALFITVLAFIGTQNATAQKLTYGLKAGASFATQSEVGDLYNNEEIRSGFTAGAFADLELNELLSVTAGIEYMQKGFDYETSIGGQTVETTGKYDYLIAPVMLRTNLDTELGLLRSKLYFNAGSYAGFNTHDELQVNNCPECETPESELKETDYGISFGGGFTFPAGKQQLMLDIRYDMGLSEVNEQNDNKNKAFSIGLGIVF